MTPAKPNDERVSGVPFLLRALRHRNYRLFFFGQLVSVTGMWMQGVALGWFVKDLAKAAGKSPELWLGMVPFIAHLPNCILPSLTGVLADRWNRRRILLVTQSLMMFQALVLAGLVYAGAAEMWHILLLVGALGLARAFDIPARQAFTVDMLDDRADLGNAIALNSSLVNAARLIGPVFAGVLIATIGAATCFLINGLTFIAIILALLAMRITSVQSSSPNGRVLEALKEGFAYVAHSPPIRTVLLLIALISFMGVTYGILMPVITEILGGGPYTYGLLLSSSGVGALGGAAYLASRRTVRGLKSRIALAVGLFGVCLIGFSFSRTLWLSVPLLVVAGFGMMVTLAAANTFLQAIVDDDKRGRVMSFWTMSFIGMVPFGSLFMGAVADRIGAMNAVLMGGSACLIGAIVFATRLPMLRRMTHPIYIRKGLIPEVVLAAARTPSQVPDTLGPINPAAADTSSHKEPQGPDKH